jgi:hypothetical protein
VAVKTLQDVDVDAEEKNKLKEMCKSFHSSVREVSEEYFKKEGRRNYVTPTSYLELLTMFTSLLAKQRDIVSSAKRRYEVGLEKLAFTADAVKDMQEELTALKPELIKTVAETEELMAKVQKEKAEVVEPKKAAVDIEVAEAAKKGDEAGRGEEGVRRFARRGYSRAQRGDRRAGHHQDGGHQARAVLQEPARRGEAGDGGCVRGAGRQAREGAGPRGHG